MHGEALKTTWGSMYNIYTQSLRVLHPPPKKRKTKSLTQLKIQNYGFEMSCGALSFVKKKRKKKKKTLVCDVYDQILEYVLEAKFCIQEQLSYQYKPKSSKHVAIQLI